MKNKNFSKNFDDVFDEEQVCYNEFNYFGYSSDKLGLAEGIPFRMQIKSFFDEKDLVSFLHTITKRQDVIFGGVEEHPETGGPNPKQNFFQNQAFYL